MLIFIPYCKYGVNFFSAPKTSCIFYLPNSRHNVQKMAKANLIHEVTAAVTSDTQLTNHCAPPQRTRGGVRLPELPNLPPAHAQNTPRRFVSSVDNQSYLTEFDVGSISGNVGENIYEEPLPEKKSRINGTNALTKSV